MNRIFGRYVLPVAAHGILMPVPDARGRELVSTEVSGADNPVGCIAGVTGYPVGLVECSVKGVLEALDKVGRDPCSRVGLGDNPGGFFPGVAVYPCGLAERYVGLPAGVGDDCFRLLPGYPKFLFRRVILPRP